MYQAFELLFYRSTALRLGLGFFAAIATMWPMPTPSVEFTGAEYAAPQLPNHKVKVKKLGQRACNEKDAKNKLCNGHLKRWYYNEDVKEQACGDIERAWGKDAEVYRCEHCKTLYLPNPEDVSGLNVAGRGSVSVFGLTVKPKS
jgi:hypothetical protein